MQHRLDALLRERKEMRNEEEREDYSGYFGEKGGDQDGTEYRGDQDEAEVRQGCYR